ncbi:MAG: tRNA (guanosine(37)-N1)-methyltransferase TrmD [Thiotrichales bacterium]|nr:MAG: tRNA (guanosine(37)-N1)-methyltransferase TrmD [Thiotrichales bacterium]
MKTSNCKFTFGVVSLFPDFVRHVTEYGVVRKAAQNNLITVKSWNPRDYANNSHGSIDDSPYGGGNGMLLQAEPVALAIEAAKQELGTDCKVCYLSPQGKVLTQKTLTQLSKTNKLILLAGRYEGVDARVIKSHVDFEISIGDYILTGGELPAMILIDGITRMLDGVLHGEFSNTEESFMQSLLECDHFTRPSVWRGKTVPEVLLSGDHEKIAKWRKEHALMKTKNQRPDLL